MFKEQFERVFPASSVILASQNIDDFLIDGVKEYTKPLFSIPTHPFLFNAGNTEPKIYIDIMQLEPSAFELIKYPERGRRKIKYQ